MKFLLALAALLLAATASLAGSAPPCAGGDHPASVASADPAPCHDAGAADHEKNHGGCGLAAFCVLMCGATLPIVPSTSAQAELVGVEFVSTADHPHTILVKPEAPPPRFVAL